MARPVIALLTDFGVRDHYVAAMKGVMLGICPDVTILDVSHDVPPQDVVNPPSGKLGNGGYATMSNFTFSIQKKHAWVSHDEVSVAVDGSKTHSHEIRMLEKIKGEWKLVGQSIHLYRPE